MTLSILWLIEKIDMIRSLPYSKIVVTHTTYVHPAQRSCGMRWVVCSYLSQKQATRIEMWSTFGSDLVQSADMKPCSGQISELANSSGMWAWWTVSGTIVASWVGHTKLKLLQMKQKNTSQLNLLSATLPRIYITYLHHSATKLSLSSCCTTTGAYKCWIFLICCSTSPVLCHCLHSPQWWISNLPFCPQHLEQHQGVMAKKFTFLNNHSSCPGSPL